MSSRAGLGIAVVACVGLLMSPDAGAAERRKMRWLTSVYIDARGDRLRHPESVACGRDFFVVADTGNRRLLRYGYRNEIVTPEAEFPLKQAYPIVVQVNSHGDLYFLDSLRQRIDVLTPDGEKLGDVSLQDVPASKKVVPKSFKIDRNDNIYILDIFSGRVVVLDAEGRYSRQLQVPAEHVFFSDVAVDDLGTILLLDGGDASVYSAGRAAEGFSRLGKSLREYMNYPTSLAIDDTGSLYLVDQFGSGLAVVGRDGSFLGRALGMGWNENRLYYPSGICINPEGTVAIADRSNSRVQLFKLAEE